MTDPYEITPATDEQIGYWRIWASHRPDSTLSADIAAMLARIDAEHKGREAEKARADAAEKREQDWAGLWYFVSDEKPLEFEKIVTDYSPNMWIQEAWKLMKASAK